VLADRYRIIGLLGRGGMGEVYRADDLRLGQAVALKFLPETLAHDAQRLAQFHNEVRTARHVSHPNVCRVYDIGEINQQLFLTMEFVDGEDLGASLKRVGRFPEERAIEIARQICAGLAAAHERGVLHRDLKPANIMLDAEGRARLMDFGLAAIGTVDEIRAGTPAYMAPEQIEGREVTVKSDVYALGLVLYELFTGKRAFQAGTLADLIDQQVSGRITPPSAIVPTLDPVIERAILRCIDRDPALRPSSALQVAASLPGGDPLAAALAAGETPSPEMVAAAGEGGATLTPLVGYGGIALAVVLLGLSAFASDRTNLYSRVPLEKPAAVLIDRAETIRKDFGYTDKPVDSAYGFDVEGDYLEWAADHGARKEHWPLLKTGRPAAVYFWYRASRTALVPVNLLSSITAEDPPLASVSGDAEVVVDTDGRLIGFSATPPEKEPAGQPSEAVAWARVFEAAGLDRAKFVEAPAQHVPAQFADDRRAWTGTYAEAPDVPIRLEAASYRGRLVSVDVRGEWSAPVRDVAASARSGFEHAFELGLIGLLLAIVVGAAIQARRNVLAGRGDRNGASRTAVFTVAIVAARWIVAPDVVSDTQAALGMMLLTLALGLLFASLAYVMYLAVEPAVRRYWPNALVTWTRLVSGRVRDPLVGRDLFVGTLAALAMSVAITASSLLPAALGLPQPIPTGAPETMLLGVRPTLAIAINTLMNGLILSLPVIIVATVLRRLLRWPWLSALAMGALLMIFNAANVGVPYLDLALRIVAAFGALFILRWFGLFALMVSIAAVRITHVAPLTLDRTRLYAPQSALVAVLILGVMAVGYWMASGASDVRTRRAP